MKFTGQVKIPDLDSPGVPASILIEDNQTEVFVEGESLGRWSLVDVRAERLVSSAFSLDLDGEKITFLADEPTDFAYRGVDQMANVWARYKSMSLPRRVIASSRSRNGTKPSRIEDLKVAIEETLSGSNLGALSIPPQGGLPATSGTSLPGLGVPPEPVSFHPASIEPLSESEPAAPVAPEVGFEPEPELVAEPVVEVVSEPEPLAEVVSEPQPEPEPEEAPEKTRSGRTPDSVFRDAVPWATEGSIVRSEAGVPDSANAEAVEADGSDSPWYASETGDTTPPVEVEFDQVAAREEYEEPAGAVNEAVPWLDPAAVPGPILNGSAEPSTINQDETSQSDGAHGEVVEPEAVEPEAVVPEAVVPEVVEPAVVESEVVEPEVVEPEVVVPETAASTMPSESSEEESADKKTYMVDLGAFEDGDNDSSRPAHQSRIPSEPEPAMAGASERSGIMGAVRSAFVRSRAEHAHEYVAAPGGMGIVRNICKDCGHISIGVVE